MADEMQVEQVVDGNGEVIQDDNAQPSGQVDQTQTQTSQQTEAPDPLKALQELQAKYDERLQAHERGIGQVKGLQAKIDKLEALLSRQSAPQATPDSYEALDPAQKAAFDKLMQSYLGQSEFGKKIQGFEQMQEQQARVQAVNDGYAAFKAGAGQEADKLEPFAADYIKSVQEAAGKGDPGAIKVLELLTSDPSLSAKLVLAEAKEAYSKSVQAQSQKATDALKASGKAASPTPVRSGGKNEDSLEAIQAMPRGPEKTAKLEAYLAANGGMEAFMSAGNR